MTIQTELYKESLLRLPNKGQQIIAHQHEDQLVVYQAYRTSIADYAVKHQQLGGNDFSYSRMSWIKPNFLWMMFRCGWAQKENQARVLALWLRKEHFEMILHEAVFSTFKPQFYTNHESWKQELAQKEVRLQWDPDHNPFGQKLERRAIQLGLKGDILAKFGKEFVTKIEDITHFVSAQKMLVDRHDLETLSVPFETIYEWQNADLKTKIAQE